MEFGEHNAAHSTVPYNDYFQDRATFRQIIVRANAIKRQQFENFLKSVEILEDMTVGIV